MAGMIKNIGLYFLVLSIPAMLGLATWQSVRYTRLEADVHKLEEEQKVWIENNKRLIAGISVLSSSERIQTLATEELGLTRIEPEAVVHVRVKRSGVE